MAGCVLRAVPAPPPPTPQALPRCRKFPERSCDFCRDAPSRHSLPGKPCPDAPTELRFLCRSLRATVRLRFRLCPWKLPGPPPRAALLPRLLARTPETTARGFPSAAPVRHQSMLGAQRTNPAPHGFAARKAAEIAKSIASWTAMSRCRGLPGDPLEMARQV